MRADHSHHVKVILTGAVKEITSGQIPVKIEVSNALFDLALDEVAKAYHNPSFRMLNKQHMFLYGGRDLDELAVQISREVVTEITATDKVAETVGKPKARKLRVKKA